MRASEFPVAILRDGTNFQLFEKPKAKRETKTETKYTPAQLVRKDIERQHKEVLEGGKKQMSPTQWKGVFGEEYRYLAKQEFVRKWCQHQLKGAWRSAFLYQKEMQRRIDSGELTLEEINSAGQE